MSKYFKFILVFVWLLSQKLAFAQTTYPVQVNTYLVPPYSLYLSDYYSGSHEKLVVQLVNRDMQKPTINVHLRLTITAGGVKLMTNPNTVTQPIPVDTGVPLRLTHEELAPYFQPANLISQGFLTNGQLPEGVVEFCFQAVEAYTGRVVSMPSCTRAWVTSQKPPLLSLPLNNENILFRDPLNVMFQWTPRHQGLTYVEYEFILKELWDTGMTPQAAFAYSPELVRETVRSTTFIYGAMQPPLLPGKRYAWAVRAQARDGLDATNVFQNDGLSEIRWFTLQDNCAPPTIVTATAERRAINLEWKSVPENIGFTVSYRPLQKDGSGSNEDWKELESNESHVIVNGLKNGTTYQYRVGNYCMVGQPVYSPLFTITLPSTDDARLAQCGIMPAINLTNKEPIKELKTGEIFMANDYPVTITKISGASGTYTGEGWTIIPFLEDAKIAVKFTSITINTDKQMIEGYVETKYDKNEGQIANLDKLTEGGFDVGTVKTGITKVDYKFDFAIPGVDAFSLNDEGQLVIKDVDGTPHTVDTSDKTGQGNEGNKVQVFPMTVQDKNGNVYQVEKVVEKDASGNEHEVAKATYIGKAGDPLTADNFDATQLDGDKAIITFKKGDGHYAFDEWKEYYDKVALIKPKYEQPLYTNYHVPWKLLVEGKTDEVKANIEIKDKSIDPKKVIFKTPKGTEFKADYNEGSKEYTIQLVAGPAGDVQEIYALHPKSDGKYYNLGKLSLATYAAQTYDVVLVPVAVPVGNDNETGYIDADAIKQTLKNIYDPVGVTWNVTRDDAFEYTGEYHLMENNTGLATYNDAMRALNNAYKDGRPKVYNANANVLFFLLNSGSKDHDNRDLTGFMPRGAQFGYIFTSEITPEKIPTTVAHELGHGRWKLFHTFDEHYGGYEREQTDNLMDYANGQHIAKWQWDVMNDPAWIVNIFESDDKSKSVTVNNIEQLSKFKNKDGSLTFISVAGKPLTIKETLDQVSFVTAEDKWNISKSNLPLGAIVDFTISGKKFVAAKIDDNFWGYRSDANEFYIDELSQKKQYQFVLAGIPCWKNLNVKFRVLPTSYLEKNTSLKEVAIQNKGEGKAQDMYFLSDYLAKGSDGVDVYGQFDLKYTDNDLFFIDGQTNGRDVCGGEALQLFNLAYLVHKNPSLVNCIPDALSDMGSVVQNEMRREYISESSGNTSSQDATYVSKSPLVVRAEMKRYSEAYQKKFQEQYLFNLNAAFSSYDQIVNAKNFDNLEDKSIGDVIDFLAVKEVKGRLCLLRNIPIDLRIKLIEKHSEWKLTDGKEELIADLIETVPDSDISKFITYLKGGGNYAPLWSLYSDLHMSEYDRFIFAITLQIMKANASPEMVWPNDGAPPLKDNSTKFLYIGKGSNYPNGWVSSTISYKSSNGIRIGLSSSGPADIWGATSYSRYYDGSPFEYVRVQFVDDYQLPSITTGDKIKSGQDIIVPAIWIYWLIEKQKTIEDFAAIRIILNAAAAGVSLATMEPGPSLAVELLANTTDVVFAINEDQIQSSDSQTAKDILTSWNVIYGAYGGTLLVKSFVKGVANFSFNTSAFKSIVQGARNTPQKLEELATSLYSLALKIGTDGISFKGKDFLRTLVLKAYMESRLLTNTLDLASNAKVFVSQEDNLVFGIFVNGAYKEIATGKTLLNTDGSILLKELRWYDPAIHGEIDNVACELSNVTYVDKSGNATKGNLQVVMTESGQLYVIIPEEIIRALSTSVRSTFDDLIKAGLKAQFKAKSILLKNTSGETAGIIYNNKFTPTKWAWEARFPDLQKNYTSEGYLIIKDGSEIKFDLWFKNGGGRKLETKEVNDYLVNGQGKDLDGQPYWAGTQVDEVVLGQNGDIVYFVEDNVNRKSGLSEPNPGQYGSKDPITTTKELREKLAVKESWKATSNNPTLRTYRVKIPLRVRSGIIGPQTENGILLQGGGHQYEIIDRLGGDWNKYLEFIEEKELIKN